MGAHLVEETFDALANRDALPAVIVSTGCEDQSAGSEMLTKIP
jgi:hypothetical protein